MDAEGSEAAILEGGREFLRRHRPFLILEASPKLLVRAGSSLEVLLERLHEQQYAVYEVGRLSLSKVEAAREGKAENWFCVPEELGQALRRARRVLWLCGLLPSLAGLNPMSTPKT
jgi:hypothetical protein